MPIDILMPALSPTMEKGNLAKWLKKEGDVIKSGDVLAEIETDKATMEVEAVDEGVLAKIMVPEGSADVPVNQVIGLIVEEGEDASAIGKADAGAKPPASKVEAGATNAQTGGPAADDAKTSPGDANAAPSLVPRADDMTLRGERPGAPPGAADTRASAGPSPIGAPASGGRVIASPLARRIAKQVGLDLAAIEGTGPNGRVVERDVRAAQQNGVRAKPAAKPAQAAPQPSAPQPSDPKSSAKAPVTADPAMTSGKTPDLNIASAPTAPDAVIKKMFEAGTFTEVPHDGMRRTIARRLVEAKNTIPHFYISLDCELDALLALREQINKSAGLDKDGKPAFKVSVNDFVIKGLALALQRGPDANATGPEGAMLRHKHSDVGVAVSVPNGLITPVVRRAEQKTLSTISNEMKDYAARARARKLRPDEYTGGTSAVSNLGMFGIKNFAAVINPPHATILAVGAGEKRVVVKEGAPAVATIMSVTLSTDHRAVDGALGAELLSAFKTLIEAPMGMLV